MFLPQTQRGLPLSERYPKRHLRDVEARTRIGAGYLNTYFATWLNLLPPVTQSHLLTRLAVCAFHSTRWLEF